MPKPWVRDTVVRKAPRFLGLVYSPMRTDRNVNSIPAEIPDNNLPMINACKRDKKGL